MEVVRVLIVEDDVRMAAAIRRGLQTEGIVTDVRGLDEVRKMPGVVDVMRHNVDQQDSRVGIIDAMVTAIAMADSPDELFRLQDRVFSAIEFVRDQA
jgi:DNA-binding response OmpR family regulator